MSRCLCNSSRIQISGDLHVTILRRVTAVTLLLFSTVIIKESLNSRFPRTGPFYIHDLWVSFISTYHPSPPVALDFLLLRVLWRWNPRLLRVFIMLLLWVLFHNCELPPIVEQLWSHFVSSFSYLSNSCTYLITRFTMLCATRKWWKKTHKYGLINFGTLSWIQLFMKNYNIFRMYSRVVVVHLCQIISL